LLRTPVLRASRGDQQKHTACYHGNLGRRLVLPKRVDDWPLTSLQPWLVKTGRRSSKHAWYYWLLVLESHLMRALFGNLLRRIVALPSPAGKASSRSEQISVRREAGERKV
jgi:hypothetical protein